MFVCLGREIPGPQSAVGNSWAVGMSVTSRGPSPSWIIDVGKSW